jgi:hypothetical protein
MKKHIHRFSKGAALVAVVVVFAGALRAWAAPPEATSAVAASGALAVARITADGKLQKPVDLATWVFLGTSLGMGYNPGSFNAEHPGQFQVVLMEPGAYREFVKTGRYAPGSMFLLAFYDADMQVRSINQHGFTQAELTNYEIHLTGTGGGDGGHAFYLFAADATAGNPMPPNNNCVRCHLAHGAFDGTFAQFYPTIRASIPKDLLEKAANDHDIH